MTTQNNWFHQTNLKSDKKIITNHDITNDYVSTYFLNVMPPEQNIFSYERGMSQQISDIKNYNHNSENKLRNGNSGNELTHTKARQNLEIRPYRSVPFAGECLTPLMETDTYSLLSSGEHTRVSKSCNTQADATRWIPQVPIVKNIQKVNNVVPTNWVRGGADTSTYYRNADYIKALREKQI